MNQLCVNSSPSTIRPATSSSTIVAEHGYDDSALEGVAANIKLLLKLTQDHKNACHNEKNGSRRMLRVATMLTILDNIRARIQKCQSFGNNRDRVAKAGPEFRRSNTIPRPSYPIDNNNNNDKCHDVADNEKEQLRREQRNLQAMCSSLGKEKEIMASELYRKVQELNGMEELINDLKAQNESLLKKVKDKRQTIVGGNVVEEVQERNKVLSENLLKSLDGYRSMKRKLKAAEEEKGCMRMTMDEMRGKIVGSLERFRRFKGVMVSPSSARNDDESRCVDNVWEEIEELESTLECFRVGNSYKHDDIDMELGDCVQVKGEVISCKPSSVLA